MFEYTLIQLTFVCQIMSTKQLQQIELTFKCQSIVSYKIEMNYLIFKCRNNCYSNKQLVSDSAMKVEKRMIYKRLQ